ncbi:MAG TPA: methyltransferase [Caulobacteraceae bacterium]|jgi:predicted methyltransferase|nr:methyltransferase [Caulobacteraceae bacterium]
MKRTLLAAVGAGALVAAVAAIAAPEVPAYVSAAVADTHRPDTDTKRDADRKPAAILAFSEVKPGDKVYELLPGGGYFTRLFSKAVGSSGHVYAVAPTVNPETGQPTPPFPVAQDAAYGNVTVVPLSLTGAKTPEPVDIVFTAQNYHDLHLARFHLDVVNFDKTLYDNLKPGGLLIIEDHSAEAGSGLRDPDKLHRIDEDVVKKEAEAAGFKLVAETDVLRNTADPRTALVFDPSIRGHTDQFVLKFRKPG